MDILQFINSNAIRNHLKKKNWQFDTLEAAWLIYHSYNHSVYEKFDAYEQLMKEYPDCRVKEESFDEKGIVKALKGVYTTNVKEIENYIRWVYEIKG